MYKLALIIDNAEMVFSSEKRGGGSVVARNLIEELVRNGQFELTVYSGRSNRPGILGVKHFIISEYYHYETGFFEEFEHLNSVNQYDAVLTVNLSVPYKNFIIQTQSFQHRVNEAHFLIRPFKKMMSKKKILAQKQQYETNSGNYKYFCVSDKIRQDYLKNFSLDEKKLFVAHPGTVQFFEKCPEIIKQETINFGLVSANSMNKSADLLLFGLFILKMLGYKFSATLIFTKEREFSPNKLLMKLLGLGKQIKTISWQSEIKDFYSETDCLVLPSKNEAFGLVALESMAFGVVPLVSSTTGVSEIIDESNGFIFERSSFWSFVLNLKKIMDLYYKDFSQFQQLSRNAFELSKKYSWKNFAQNILDNI